MTFRVFEKGDNDKIAIRWQIKGETLEFKRTRVEVTKAKDRREKKTLFFYMVKKAL